MLQWANWKTVIESELQGHANWKIVIESEIQGHASMRGYGGLWQSLKTNYGIIVRRDIVMDILKRIDPKEINMPKGHCLP